MVYEILHHVDMYSSEHEARGLDGRWSRLLIQYYDGNEQCLN